MYYQSYSGIHGYSDKGGRGVGGNPWTVYVLYTDTLTRGGGREGRMD